MSAVAASLRFSILRRISWPHPEWWSLCLSSAAWLLMLSRTAPWGAGPHASHAHAGHSASGAAGAFGTGALASEAFWWLVMIAAMMFPMVLEPVRYAAARSLWRRRHRAIVGFLAGYLAPWMLFGVAVSAATAVLRAQTGPRPSAAAAAVSFGVGLLWQFTRAKRLAVLGCHRTRPIAPTGWRADRDCLRYGWAVGRSCLVSCWALMLACALSGHGLAAMVGGAGIGWAERNAARPDHPLLCAAVAGLALAYAVAALV